MEYKIGDKVKYLSSIGVVVGYCYVNNKPACKLKSLELSIHSEVPIEFLKSFNK